VRRTDNSGTDFDYLPRDVGEISVEWSLYRFIAFAAEKWNEVGFTKNAYQNLIPTRNGLRISGLEFGFDRDAKNHSG
jgi:hypothetical protein